MLMTTKYKTINIFRIKSLFRMILLFFIVLFLCVGCTSNTPEEKTILDSEIRFRDYEWYFSDKDKVRNDLSEAYYAYDIPPFTDDTPFIAVNGMTIHRIDLEYYETTPYAALGVRDYKERERVYLEGQPLDKIYIDFIRDSKNETTFKLVSGAYIFTGGQKTFKNLKEYLTEKYGKPSKQKTRYFYQKDYFGYEFEKPDLYYNYRADVEYFEWYGQNNTVLELALYTWKNGKKEEAIVRYYVPDGYNEYNELVNNYKQEQEKKKEEEKRKNNGVL